MSHISAKEAAIQAAQAVSLGFQKVGAPRFRRPPAYKPAQPAMAPRPATTAPAPAPAPAPASNRTVPKLPTLNTPEATQNSMEAWMRHNYARKGMFEQQPYGYTRPQFYQQIYNHLQQPQTTAQPQPNAPDNVAKYTQVLNERFNRLLPETRAPYTLDDDPTGQLHSSHVLQLRDNPVSKLYLPNNPNSQYVGQNSWAQEAEKNPGIPRDAFAWGRAQPRSLVGLHEREHIQQGFPTAEQVTSIGGSFSPQLFKTDTHAMFAEPAAVTGEMVNSIDAAHQATNSQVPGNIALAPGYAPSLEWMRQQAQQHGYDGTGGTKNMTELQNTPAGQAWLRMQLQRFEDAGNPGAYVPPAQEQDQTTPGFAPTSAAQLREMAAKFRGDANTSTNTQTDSGAFDADLFMHHFRDMSRGRRPWYLNYFMPHGPSTYYDLGPMAGSQDNLLTSAMSGTYNPNTKYRTTRGVTGEALPTQESNWHYSGNEHWDAAERKIQEQENEKAWADYDRAKALEKQNSLRAHVKRAAQTQTLDLADRFTPDYTPEQLENLGVYDALYRGHGPRLASLGEWKPEWVSEHDPKGWAQWYKRYTAGRRIPDEDERQIKRWLSFKARHGGPFAKNPTPRRGWALRNWGIDPSKLVDKDQAQSVNELLAEHQRKALQKYVQEKHSNDQPKRTAVIIRGNPKFVENNAAAAQFYAQLQKHLEQRGYAVSQDAGEPHTVPSAANLWLAHSRGVDRLPYAPKGTRGIALGAPGGINHPDDKAMRPGDVPTAAHYTLTPEMLKALDDLIQEKTADLLPEIKLQEHQQRVADRIAGENPRLLVYHGLGSGKSLSALAAAEAAKKVSGGNYGIVVPASLKGNFEKEIKKFTQGSNPEVMSYTGLGMGKKFKDQPETLIMDEAARLRNPNSAMTQAAMQQAREAQRLLLLTGTPITNAPTDLAPLVAMLDGKNIDPKSFGERYIGYKKVSPGWLGWLRGVKPGERPYIKNEKELRSLLEGKVDYQPSKTPEGVNVNEEIVRVPLSKEQQKIQHSIRTKIPPGFLWKLDQEFPLSRDELSRLNSFLTGLRQVGLSTQPFRADKNPLKAFDQSAKLQKAFENLKATLDSDPRKKAIIYSNFVDAGLAPYAAGLERAGIPSAFFHGSISPKARQAAVDAYNNNKLRALLIGPAGAEGISTKGTSLIQLLDPHWNEARTQQARGRGLRFDSHAGLPEELKNVAVQRYLTQSEEPGWLGRHLLGRKRERTADEVLERLTAEKEQLNESFRNLLKEIGSEKRSDYVVKTGKPQLAAVFRDLAAKNPLPT